jgi:transcriptional regulator with XRE-family HTH domain/DNA-binding transcriptional regulator YiaG
MTALTLTAVVFDESIYPRSEWQQSTVDRYAEALAAGEQFPPIVLERGTNRLLDGMHRARAHRQAELAEIAVEFHDVPAGVPAKLYAASLSTRHGDRINREDLAEIAREIARENPDYSFETIARYCGVTRKTVARWAGDVVERRRAVNKAAALILCTVGWPQANVATQIGVRQSTVSEWLSEMGNDPSSITEDLLAAAAALLPLDASHAIEQIREERIFATWSADERDLLDALRAGNTVVVTLRGAHDNLIRWADSAGLYVRVDRKTAWGNPFEMPADGDRDTVIANYAAHYLPHKPSLLAKVDTLRGKALGCWCAPEPCHADVLREAAS